MVNSMEGEKNAFWLRLSVSSYCQTLKANPGPLDDAAIRRLFERIIDEARSLERHSMESSADEANGAKE